MNMNRNDYQAWFAALDKFVEAAFALNDLWSHGNPEIGGLGTENYPFAQSFDLTAQAMEIWRDTQRDLLKRRVENPANVADSLREAGYEIFIEYGWLTAKFPDGRFAAFGDSNETWSCDVYKSEDDYENGEQPASVVDLRILTGNYRVEDVVEAFSKAFPLANLQKRADALEGYQTLEKAHRYLSRLFYDDGRVTPREGWDVLAILENKMDTIYKEVSDAK
jgi:hypothetical protein